jgi:hypothetical protein
LQVWILAESCGEILDVSAMRYVVMQFLALRIDDGSSAEDAVAGTNIVTWLQPLSTSGE